MTPAEARTAELEPDTPFMVDGCVYGLEDDGDRPIDPEAFRQSAAYARAAEARMYGPHEIDDSDQDPRHKAGNMLAMLPALVALALIVPVGIVIIGGMKLVDLVLGRDR